MFCIISIALALTGCQTIAANFATNMAVDLALRPVTQLVVEGGKAAYRAAEEQWQVNSDKADVP